MDVSRTVPVLSIAEAEAFYTEGCSARRAETPNQIEIAAQAEASGQTVDVPGCGAVDPALLPATLPGRPYVPGEVPASLRLHVQAETVIRLIFAARDLADRNLIRMKGGEVYLCAECASRISGERGAHGHAELCRAGRVCGLLEQLQGFSAETGGAM